MNWFIDEVEIPIVVNGVKHQSITRIWVNDSGDLDSLHALFLLEFYAVFNIISVILRRQFTDS